ncbi:MAG: hypothetical protein ABSH14_01550 [Verrucomicrobiia bacterium]|jgi:hypothetical protein
MNEEAASQISAEESAVFRRIWLIAAITATIGAPMVASFRVPAPWLIAVPISIGILVVVFMEFAPDTQDQTPDSQIHGPVSAIPEGFQGLAAYKGAFALEIKRRKRVPKGQLSFDGLVVEVRPTRKAQFATDDTGKEILIVDCDRFVGMLVSRLIEDADKAAEHALAVAWQRFGKAAGEHSDIKIFIEDKTVREAIKSDFRGNILTIIAHSGEKIVKELLKDAEEKATASEETSPKAKPATK